MRLVVKCLVVLVSALRLTNSWNFLDLPENRPWSIERIPNPPLEFQQRVFKELTEARKRAIQILEEAGMSVATGMCKNHPARPCPSRGAYAGLCEECRAVEVERRRNGSNSQPPRLNGSVSVEHTLKELIPKAKAFDKKNYELKTKKGVVEAIEREVAGMKLDFVQALYDLADRLA